MIYSLYIIPFYNSFFKKYQQVIIIEPKPTSFPLLQFVNTFPFNNLSPFIPRSNLSCFNILVFKNLSIKSENFFLSPDDIPFFIDFLTSNNFTINDFKFQFNNPLPIKKTFVLSFQK